VVCGCCGGVPRGIQRRVARSGAPCPTCAASSSPSCLKRPRKGTERVCTHSTRHDTRDQPLLRHNEASRVGTALGVHKEARKHPRVMKGEV
jgi:hypothetical protein